MAIDAIERMAELARAGSYVIEDAAASLGTRVDGQIIGTFGDAAIFSFDSTQLVNVLLKGGFLVVRDDALCERCREFATSATQPIPLARKGRYLVLGAALLMIEPPGLYRPFHNLKFRWRGRFTDDQAGLSESLRPFYVDRLAEWQSDLPTFLSLMCKAGFDVKGTAPMHFWPARCCFRRAVARVGHATRVLDRPGRHAAARLVETRGLLGDSGDPGGDDSRRLTCASTHAHRAATS